METFVRTHIFIDLSAEMIIQSNITSCSMEDRFQAFGGNYCLHFHGFI
jgi:hypothetical protein